ncbi:MAG TPA: hypothetical protein PLZ51_29510, partial [Aggregatilineales bacterium]|nr:hypothetical protein [Aggregatilineales bacterium]
PPLESAGCGLKHILSHPAWIRHIADSPDKTEIATSATDGVIRIWDAKTGVLLRQWQTNHETVNALAWGGLGMLIATSGSGNTAQVWDAWTGDLICHINHKFYGLQNV